MFQFFKTPFSTKITNFTKFDILEPKFKQNFCSRASNFAKVQFFKSYFFQKFSSFSPIFFKKISSLSPYFDAYPFFKPPFAAIRTAHLYPNESWVPPPRGLYLPLSSHLSPAYLIGHTQTSSRHVPPLRHGLVQSGDETDKGVNHNCYTHWFHIEGVLKLSKFNAFTCSFPLSSTIPQRN